MAAGRARSPCPLRSEGSRLPAAFADRTIPRRRRTVPAHHSRHRLLCDLEAFLRRKDLVHCAGEDDSEPVCNFRSREPGFGSETFADVRRVCGLVRLVCGWEPGVQRFCAALACRYRPEYSDATDG